MGMELDAYWQLDANNGMEIASSGFCAVLRDYGRFGRFIANGVINGQRCCPLAGSMALRSCLRARYCATSSPMRGPML